MTHPLTDEICRQIVPFSDLWSPTAECHDMRAAADWQLEQIIEWLEKNLIKQDYIETYHYLYGDSFAYCRTKSYIKKEKLLEDLKKAMRPQQQD